MKMKIKIKISLTIILLIVINTSTSAQTPLFRNKGYKGSVGVSSFCIAFPGVETTHGYMFDSVHYLGVGIGANILFPSKLIINIPAALIPTEFIEYQAYILRRNSTPVLGARVGCLQSWDFETIPGDFLCFFEPTFGWSWGIAGGRYGIKPALGFTFFLFPKANRPDEIAVPYISVNFEF